MYSSFPTTFFSPYDLLLNRVRCLVRPHLTLFATHLATNGINPSFFQTEESSSTSKLSAFLTPKNKHVSRKNAQSNGKTGIGSGLGSRLDKNEKDEKYETYEREKEGEELEWANSHNSFDSLSPLAQASVYSSLLTQYHVEQQQRKRQDRSSSETPTSPLASNAPRTTNGEGRRDATVAGGGSGNNGSGGSAISSISSSISSISSSLYALPSSIS